jgi:hypothetical protein
LDSLGLDPDVLRPPCLALCGVQAKLITEISGGWKMKLALARAMLLKADILLLDEPTNHLDTTNVAWLENYLVTQSDITCMTVSHDRSAGHLWTSLGQHDTHPLLTLSNLVVVLFCLCRHAPLCRHALAAAVCAAVSGCVLQWLP